MKKSIYISAIYTSPSNSMGGNTKIMIELMNNLSEYYNFVVFTTEPDTFRKNIRELERITLINVPYNFEKFNYLGHFREIEYVYKFYKKYFNENEIGKDSYFYSSSDFGPDVVPLYRLRGELNFKWIATLYLFVPNPFENLAKKYGFPFYKYIIYYLYQKYLFFKILKRFDLCLITNTDDKKYFPKSKQNLILPIYGGVNIEQVEAVMKASVRPMKYDAIFCSRLHQQKGISQLLEIWNLVVKVKKDAKLGIIGNGESSFEKFLKEKAMRLNVENNIEWLGYVNNEDKYRIYLQSKFLVHATVYDNNGMVAAEALCSGLPVVMYDLDKLKFYQDGCVKVEVGNRIKYAEAILKLINDDEFYNKIKPSSEAVMKLREMWRWENRASIFKNFLDKYEKNDN